MTLALAFALAAALTWGTGDYLAKLSAERFGFWPTMLGINMSSTLLLVLPAGMGYIPFGQVRHWGVLALLAILNTAGGLLLYYAFEHGQLSVVSPVAATYPVFSGLFAFVFGHQSLAYRLIIAAGMVITGTLIVTRGPATQAGERHSSALWSAAAAAVTFAFLFFALGTSVGTQSLMVPISVFRAQGTLMLLTPLLFGRRAPVAVFRTPGTWVIGVLDSLGYIAYAAAARHGPTAVVSAVGGLFSVWTVALAVGLLQERLSRQQWAGVGLIFTGILLLAAN